MKKKLLSLVLAGAMVASTSVSAFAATPSTTTEKTEISAQEDEKNVDVRITGNVLDNKGNAMPGTIKVTVPTATTFNVTKEGKLNSAAMTITNEGDEQISVVVNKFEDSNGTDKIEVVKKTEFGTNKSQNPRKQIWLRLKGGEEVVSFGSASRGQVYSVTDGNDGEVATDKEIGKIRPGDHMTLELEGEGGTQNSDSDTEAIQDEFKLVLKIKREKNK